MAMRNLIVGLVLSVAGIVGLGCAREPLLAAEAPAGKGKGTPGFRLVRCLKGGKQIAADMAFSPDGKYFVSTSRATSIYLWGVASGRLIRQVTPKSRCANSPHFVRGGHGLVAQCDYRLQWFDVPSLAARERLDLSATGAARFCVMAPSPDNKYLAFQTPTGIALWDVTNRKCAWRTALSAKRPGHRSVVRHVSFGPNGKVVAVALGDATVSLCAVREGKELRRLVDRTIRIASIGGLTFSPDGKCLAVGMGMENLIRVWDPESGESCRAIRWGRPPVLIPPAIDTPWVRPGVDCVAFSPDGKVLAGACSDGKVRLWEVATGSLRCEAPVKGLYRLAFSMDGKFLATNNDVTNGDVQFWDWWDLQLSRPAPFGAHREQLWNALAAEDAAVAYRAMTLLHKMPKEATKLLGNRLRGAPPISVTKLDQLLADLNHDDFTKREKASQELGAMGIAAAEKLRVVLKRTRFPEVRTRVRKLLDQLQNGGGPERLRWLRGVEVLEHIGTREAQGVLTRLAAGTADSMQIDEARAALKRLSHWRGMRP